MITLTVIARARYASVIALLATSPFTLVGCGDEPTTPSKPDTTVVALSVQPPSLQFTAVGDTAPLTATATNRSGAVLSGAVVTWSSLDPGVATVDANGLVKSTGLGNTTIRAVSGSTTAGAAVLVEQTVKSIRFSVDSVGFLDLRSTLQVVAQPIDNRGNVVPEVGVTITSTNRRVATAESDGKLTSLADGVAFLVATAASVSDSIPVTVHAIGRRSTLSGGEYHTCAIDPGGTAWCWGQGRLGQLGTGKTFFSSDIPVQAPTPEPLAEISAGKDHTCALAVDGSMYCWGYNADGQLGIGSTTDHPSPQLIADTAHFQQVSAGAAHSCAVTVGGKALCWGSNSSGQLGRDGSTGSVSPMVVDHDSAFIAVATGDRHTCALAPSGKAYCWGASSFGQLGDGTTSASPRPVPVAGGLYFAALAAGRDHTCGITTGGAAYCWGSNDHGQIGDGSTALSTVPRAVSLDDTFVDIGAGAGFSCAATSTGEVRCWGYNVHGQLGEGTRTSRASPTIATLSWDAFGLGVGAFHACAQSSGGDLECWGNQVTGATGVGDYFPRPVFAKEGQAEVNAGNSHTCSRDPAGNVFCWGWSGPGILGNSNQYTGIPKPAGNWAGVTASAIHSCAWTVAGKGYCWGWNESRLGNGGTSPQFSPFPIAGDITFSLISAGVAHTCGLDTQGRPWCWGSASGDHLGIGSVPAQRQPVRVLGDHVFRDLDAGERLSCGIDLGGQAWCWGIIAARATNGPTLIATGERLETITVGFNHACGLDERGAAYCWGGNDSGQLGSGSFASNDTPTAVTGGLVFTALETKYHHTCGLTESGRVYCWGLNSYGQLGNGERGTNQSMPVAVAGAARYTQIAPGWNTTCALTETQDVHCWGTQGDGEIGGVFVVNPVPAASPPYRVEAAPWWARTPPPEG